MTDCRWQSLLTADRAAEARSVVLEIVAGLEQRRFSPMPGLKGEAATALLFAQCGRNTARARLEYALSIAVEQPGTIALFGGLTGTSWVLGHLVERADAEPLLAHFDAALLRYLEVPHWNERVDLVSGLAGIGVSVAQRRENRAVQIAELVVSHLETTAICGDTGITWRTPPRFLPEPWRTRCPEGAIELGVAHGVPGIIGMLARFVEADLHAARSARLLERAIGWLLPPQAGGARSFCTDEPDVRVRRDSIGWCYGAAGVAGALLCAGIALNSTPLLTEARALLHRTAASCARRTITESGFCAGVAGLAHVYNTAFQRTQDPQLRREAERWITELLDHRKAGVGIAGYGTWRDDGDLQRREVDTTLITGVVGIALVLLAATEGHEPVWQRLFML